MSSQNMPNRSRDRKFTFRATKEEYEKILALIEATGQRQQSFLLNAALGSKILDTNDKENLIEQSKTLNDIDLQLRGIGTNLNQLARHANEQGDSPAENYLREFAKENSEYRREVNILWQLTRRLIHQQNHMEQ